MLKMAFLHEHLKLKPLFLLLISQSFFSEATAILNNQNPYDRYSNEYRCSTDEDCGFQERLLVCINNQCQCLRGGVTYLNGIVQEYNMEWSVVHDKCVSKPGSPCTFKDQWYPYDSSSVKIDCQHESVCLSPGPLGQQNVQSQIQSQRQGQGQRQYPYPILEPGNSDYGHGHGHGSVGASSASGGSSGGGSGSGIKYGICVQNAYVPSNQNQNNYNHNHGRPTPQFVGHGGNQYPISPTKGSGETVKSVMSILVISLVGMGVIWSSL